MTNTERYSMAGSLLFCRDCGTNARFIVTDFGPTEVSLSDIEVEAAMHEGEKHETTFETPATTNIEAAAKASTQLALRAERVAEEIRSRQGYFACYKEETAYRDGLLNGMGGTSGDLASLLGPDAVQPLARALKALAETGREYPELVQDHDRKSCADFTCEIFGHLVEVARGVAGQLDQ